MHSNREVKASLALMSLSSSHLAVAYSLEADADHRKNGLIPRATFTEASEHTYESKGTIILGSKGVKECVKRQLTIQVRTLFGNSSLVIKVHCGRCVMLCDVDIPQENIKDKLRGIPIDVSVDIQGSKRKRRQSSTQLSPVLDASEPTRSEVRT